MKVIAKLRSEIGDFFDKIKLVLGASNFIINDE